MKKTNVIINYYCQQNNCDGLLLASPMVLLCHPCLHKYQCLSCGHRYLRSDDSQEIRSDYHQQRNMYFNDFRIESIQWALRKNRKDY